MVKLLGLACLFIAVMRCGWLFGERVAQRPHQVAGLIQALTTLETEIAYGLVPLPQAFARVASVVKEPISTLFAAVHLRLTTWQSECTASERFVQAMNDHWARTALLDSTKQTLLSLAPMLGLTDRHDQSKHIRLVLAKLTAEEAALREQQQRYESLYKRLGFLTAILLVIVLY